jgi:WD40 repeat protein
MVAVAQSVEGREHATYLWTVGGAESATGRIVRLNGGSASEGAGAATHETVEAKRQSGLAGAVAWHPNGRLLLTIDTDSEGGSGQVSVWDIAGDQPVMRLTDTALRHGAQRESVFHKVSPDWQRLLTQTGFLHSAVQLWDMSNGKPVTPPIQQRRGLDTPPWQLWPLFNPNGRMVSDLSV